MFRFGSSWINIAVAVLGGISLGWGIGRLITEFTLWAMVWTLLGFVLLWWAVSDTRKVRSDTPESERDGSHTME